MTAKQRAFLAVGGGLLSLVLTTPLLAHHANAAYDTSKTVTVKGTVTKWQLINPHSGLWIEVKSAQGPVQVWSGEFGGTLDLFRAFRWTKNTFKLGDEVTMVGNPARDGGTAMYTTKIIFADGKEVVVAGA